MSFIDNLQRKPKSTRILILWIASIGVMLIIAFIWISNFSKNINQGKTSQESERMQLPSLFESLEKDISVFKQGLNASVEEIKNQTKELEGLEETNINTEQNEGQKQE